MQDRSCIVGCVIVSTLSDSVQPLLNRAIASITKASEKSNVKSKIVVVSSEFGSYPSQLIAPDLFIHTPNHAGYGAMNNAGIGELLKLNFGITHFLLLNDDAWLEENFFEQLKKLVTKSKIEIDVFVPLIYQGAKNTTINSFGMEIFLSGYAHDSTRKDVSTAWGSAACIVFSRSLVLKMIERFGMFFNEQLYFYYEDVELSFRAFSLSPNIVKSTLLKAHHLGSYTSGKASDFIVFNTLVSYLWTFLMTWPKRVMLRFGLAFLLVYFWLCVKFVIDGKADLVWRVLLNTKNSFSQLMEMRRKIQKSFPKKFDFSHRLTHRLFRTRKREVLV